MTGLEIAAKLDEARVLIEDGWTQGENARGKLGRGVDANGKAAVCFCAAGALMHVAGGFSQTYVLRKALYAVLPHGEYIILEDWNDAPERTHAEVIDAFKRAAELARGGAA